VYGLKYLMIVICHFTIFYNKVCKSNLLPNILYF